MSTVVDVGSVRVGRQRTPAKHTGRYPTKYIRAANITPDGLDLQDILEMDFTPGERNTFNLERSDIVLAEASGSGTHVGRAAMWQGEIPDCCFQNTVIRFRSHLAIPAYALLLFRYYSLSGVFARTARGTGILHLGATRFSGMRFPLPPQQEQQRIADEVERRTLEVREAQSSLQSALANIERQNNAILAAAATGELVEPEAEIAAREERSFEDAQELLRRINGADGQLELADLSLESPDTNPLYSRSLPPGWIWCRVDEVGELTIGRQRAPKYQQGPNMRPYLRVKNVYENYINTSDVLRMNFTPEEYEIYRLRWGDILLNEGQSPEFVGRPAMFRDEVPGACFQNSLIRFRASPAVDPDFVLLVFRYYLHAGIFRQAARWTTNIAHLSLRRLVELPFPLPPIREQERIAAEATRRLQASADQEQAARSSLAQLPELETEILAQAVQGRLVPQYADEEPASQLVARLGPVPTLPRPSKSRIRTQNDADRDTEAHEMSLIFTDDSNALPTISLADVLRSADRPLTLPELFAMAGYNRDSTQNVEHFYLMLRDELGRSLRAIEIDETSYLEVIDDATA